MPSREEQLRERVLEGMIYAVAEKGYIATSVADVIAAAGVGRSSFYKFFADKAECYLATHELIVDRVAERLAAVERLEAQLISSEDQASTWPRRVQARLNAVLDLIAEQPAMARSAVIEVSTAGPEAMRRHRAALERLAPLLDEGRQLSDGGERLPSGLATMALGGAIELLVEALRSEPEPDLAGLRPDLYFALLMPYLGPERAAAEMRRAYADS